MRVPDLRRARDWRWKQRDCTQWLPNAGPREVKSGGARVDQRRTDFPKGRSLAIQAVKTALETAGFALPEPIYRLRFDETMQTIKAGAKKPGRHSETRGADMDFAGRSGSKGVSAAWLRNSTSAQMPPQVAKGLPEL